jgi:hypothetical protein
MSDEVDRKGLGFVDVFTPNGNLMMRVESGPWLNAPWGVALAPSSFGELSNRLLIGNFEAGLLRPSMPPQIPSFHFCIKARVHP